MGQNARERKRRKLADAGKLTPPRVLATSELLAHKATIRKALPANAGEPISVRYNGESGVVAVATDTGGFYAIPWQTLYQHGDENYTRWAMQRMGDLLDGQIPETPPRDLKTQLAKQIAKQMQAKLERDMMQALTGEGQGGGGGDGGDDDEPPDPWETAEARCEEKINSEEKPNRWENCGGVSGQNCDNPATVSLLTSGRWQFTRCRACAEILIRNAYYTLDSDPNDGQRRS